MNLAFVLLNAGEISRQYSDSSDDIYTRDNLGRATTINTKPVGLTPNVYLYQKFDSAGNRTELKGTIGSTLDFKNTYAYDALNRLSSIVQQGQSGGNGVTAKRVTFDYNSLGQQTSINRYQSTGTSNAVAASTFTFDTLNRLSSLSHAQGGTTLASYSYGYDSLSRPTSITNNVEGTSTFSYDATSQLTVADHSTQSDESYSYNANGSRTGTGYTTGSNNLTTASPGFTYTYDDEGNRISRTETATGKVEEYAWDYRNRLTTVKKRNTSGGAIVQQVDYAYDNQNRLVKRTFDADGAGAGAASTQFWVYDEGINAVMQFDGAAATNLSHRYLWSDQVDQLLADEQITTPGSAGNTLWALSDHLGTIRDVADLNEGTNVTSVTNHRTYNAYGKLISETNAAVDLIYGFTGKQLDDATGMQHNLNRWYDAALGQWLSEDPIGFSAGDENVRRYVKSMILHMIDSEGLDEREAYSFASELLYGTKYKIEQKRLQDLMDDSKISTLKAVDSENYRAEKTDDDIRFYIFDNKYIKSEGEIVQVYRDNDHEDGGFDSYNYAQTTAFYLSYHLGPNYDISYLHNEEINHGLLKLSYQGAAYYIDPMAGIVSEASYEGHYLNPTDYYNSNVDDPSQKIYDDDRWNPTPLYNPLFTEYQNIVELFLQSLSDAGITDYRPYLPKNYLQK